MKSKAIKAAEKVMEDLNGRKGYDNIWDDLDDTIRNEIKTELAEIIEKVFDGRP